MKTLPNTNRVFSTFGDVTAISQNLLEAGRPLQGINSPASGILTKGPAVGGRAPLFFKEGR